MAPIPAAAFNIGAALVAAEVGVPVGEPWCRVHLGGSRWMTVRADRMGEDIVVSIEPSTPESAATCSGARTGCPTARPRLAQLARGRDTGQIARVLVLSEHTVNDHVQSVLAKTGSRTRGVLLARASGSAAQR